MRSNFLFLLIACGASALKILAPMDMRGEVPHTSASFGVPNYGGSITGQLFYWPQKHLGCEPLDRNLIPESHRGRTIIVVLDRGNCTFVQKVRDAENVAANAVVIVNSDDSHRLTMADDGTGRNIGIPSVLISRSEGLRLENSIQLNTKIMVEMSWSMPHPDNHVEWELWTSSDDRNAASFVSEFIQPALALGQSVSFKPNYGIIDGSWYGCDTPSSPCQTQCTNGGRYCAEDPEHDLEHGSDGRDIVRENLRQMCIWQYANATGIPQLWWHYIQAFAVKCRAMGTMSLQCSNSVIAEVDSQQQYALTTAVANCVASSGGSGDNDGVNKLFEASINYQSIVGVAILPSVRINEKNYHGSLACPTPIELSTCPVLGAICAGFQVGSAPTACKTDYCWDPKGVDACGVCGGDGSSCAGCDDKPNSGLKVDVCGVCGGTGSFDLCGSCFQADSPQRNRACADTISVSLELSGLDSAGILDREREIEAAIAELLTPNVTSGEDVRILALVPNNNATSDVNVTVKLEIAAHPGTGHATSASFQQALQNDGFDRIMYRKNLGLSVSRRDQAALPPPKVSAGTPAVGRVSYIPTSPIKSDKETSGLHAGELVGIAVAGAVCLAMFGMGVRHYVHKREQRVRMDMRNLIQDMGKPMQDVDNPTGKANVDFSAL